MQDNDTGADTALRHRNTGLYEQAISGDHRIAIDLQLFGKRANRRQACAGSKLAGIDQVAYRLCNLCRGLCGDRGNRVGRNERLGHHDSSTSHQGSRLKAEILGTYVTFWLSARLRIHYLSPPLKLSSVKPLMRSMKILPLLPNERVEILPIFVCCRFPKPFPRSVCEQLLLQV